MFTAADLVNLCHQLYFFLAVRTLKIPFLSNVEIYNAVLSTIVRMLYITSPGSVYLITEKFVFFDYLRPFPSPSAPSNL